MLKTLSPKNKIVIVPLGEVDFILVNRLASNLASCFSVPVDILQGMRMPVEAYNPKRCQYYSTVILNKLELLKSHSQERLLGVVDGDLYVPSRSFVTGEADTQRKLALISLSHLRQESFLPGDYEDIYFKRIVKEAIHRIGHLIGLVDCRNPKCVMYLSSDLWATDQKGIKFCDNCKRKIKITV